MIRYTILALGIASTIHFAGFAWFIAVAAGAAAQCAFSYMQTGNGASLRMAVGVLVVAGIPRLIVPILFGDSDPLPVSDNVLETISWALSIGCFIGATAAGVVSSPAEDDACGLNRKA